MRLKFVFWHFMNGSGREPAQIRMNRASSQSAMRCSMNDCFGAVGDIARGKDAIGASSQCLFIDQQTAPRSYCYAGTFREERRIGRSTNGDDNLRCCYMN